MEPIKAARWDRAKGVTYWLLKYGVISGAYAGHGRKVRSSYETPFVNRLGATFTLFLSVTAKIRLWGGG
jgi:hypothetical protein